MPAPRLALVCFAVSALFHPAVARAQACLGIPTAAGQGAFQAGIVLREDDPGVEIALRYDARGRLALGGRIEADGVDAIGVDADWELLGGPSYACPLIGFEFADVHGDDQIRIPLGLGLAHGLPADGFRLYLFAVPQVWIVSRDRDDDDAEVEGAADVGLTLGGSRFYGRLAARVSSTPDDRVLIGGGLRF